MDGFHCSSQVTLNCACEKEFKVVYFAQISYCVEFVNVDFLDM